MEKELIIEKWEEIKIFIREEYGLTQVSYSTWIENLKVAKIEGNLVIISIPSDNAFTLNYINKNYKEVFQHTITQFMNELYDVEFVLQSEQVVEEVPEVQENSSEKFGAKFENANLNPKYRFDTFVVGNNNKFAYSACLAVAESPGNTYNPLFLYGSAGLGKTHLMHSVGHFILEENPKKRVLYVTSEQFTNEVIESIRSGNATYMSRLRDKYRTVDVLLIDDIQFIIGKESTQEEFFHTFNELHQAGKQIVLSSDRPPKEMETLDERYRSRFEWGLIADIQAPDYETRMAILRRNADEIGRRMDDKVLEYIADNIKSNIRELEGAFNKIIAYSRLNNVTPNLETAREALKDIVSPDSTQTVNPGMIAETVCDHYGVNMKNVASRSRNSDLVVPRQVIMYLCREYTDCTLENIAKLLGKKDHSTVMYGVNKIKGDVNSNAELKGNIDTILKKLNIQN